MNPDFTTTGHSSTKYLRVTYTRQDLRPRAVHSMVEKQLFPRSAHISEKAMRKYSQYLRCTASFLNFPLSVLFNCSVVLLPDAQQFSSRLDPQIQLSLHATLNRCSSQSFFSLHTALLIVTSAHKSEEDHSTIFKKQSLNYMAYRRLQVFRLSKGCHSELIEKIE